MSNSENAFNWIINLLEAQAICFKITGGLAARVYGSQRPLADIDIEVADEDVKKIAALIKDYIIWGPARLKDEVWDLELVTLRYLDQDIDISGSGGLFFDQTTKIWASYGGDLNDVEKREVFGRVVPVEAKESLIAYKKKLARDVDLEDVKQISN